MHANPVSFHAVEFQVAFMALHNRAKPFYDCTDFIAPKLTGE